MSLEKLHKHVSEANDNLNRAYSIIFYLEGDAPKLAGETNDIGRVQQLLEDAKSCIEDAITVSETIPDEDEDGS